MTYCSVYLADLDHPGDNFSWDDGDWNGNIPAAMSKDFPSTREHYNGLYKSWVEERGIEYKQTDFGGWVARVTKDKIEDYLRYAYDTDPRYTGPKRKLIRKELVDELAELRAFVKGLDDQKIYGLVAEEY